jgi:nitrogen regulatory protein PII
MKLIVVFIQPENMTAVKATLDGLGVRLLMVGQVLDYREAHTTIYRGLELRQPSAMLRLEIAVQDSVLDAACAALVDAAGGRDGAGIGQSRVFVTGESIPVPLGQTRHARTVVTESPPPAFFSRRFERVS